jgi:exopolyphosphatase/guanosine-5'-triphosphate,3'-diphosphate pyrophosphatase
MKRTLRAKVKSKSWVRVQGGPILACIDMGTNSFHMIVCQATPERDHFDVITRVREAVPLIRRALGAHYIDEDATRSAVRILRDMKQKALQRGATTIIAVATSAVRESKNGEEVLSRIRQELEIDAKMISGREEARLIYLGVLWSMPDLSGEFGIVDIGGGSTEIIVGNRHQRSFAESYKLGAARLTQRFFRKGEANPESIKELHDEVRGVLRPAASRIAELGGVPQLIGTSGTFQTLAKLDRERAGRPHAELHGYKLSSRNLEKVVTEVEDAALTGRKIAGISSDRGQTILAGAIVALEIMRSLKVNDLKICTAALREGAVVDRFLQTGWLDTGLDLHKDPRSDSVHSLLEKYHADVEHAEQVARIAAEIFLQTHWLLHQYPESVGHLLWSAAMLHDVGSFVGRNGHHKHSYYLIKNGGLLGHSEEEVNLIACIARYHRGSFPKESHEAFASVNGGDRKLVADMAAILRIAEALDRSHRRAVENLKVVLEPASKSKYDRRCVSIMLKLRDSEKCEPETWAFDEKKVYFEHQFDVNLSLKVAEDASFPEVMLHSLPPL